MAFVVTSTWIARPGEEAAVEAAIGRMIAPSREEPGCLSYEPHRDLEDPRVFFLYERYTDRAAYEAHLASAHFTEFGAGEALPRLERRERRFFETLLDRS